MSIHVSSLVWQNGPTKASDRLMLLAIADNSDDYGLAWPGMERLAAKCCVQPDAARATVRRLEVDGWVTVIRGGGTIDGGKHGRPNRYQIDLTRLRIATPPSSGGLPADEAVATPPWTPCYPPVDTVATPPSTGGEPSVEPSKEPSVFLVAAKAPTRPEVQRICEHLATRIEGNGSKRPTVTRGWETAARLMLDRDQRTEAEVIGAIDWCQDDEFWRGNILSMPKLREKYDQLRLQAVRRRNGTGPTLQTQLTAQMRATGNNGYEVIDAYEQMFASTAQPTYLDPPAQIG